MSTTSVHSSKDVPPRYPSGLPTKQAKPKMSSKAKKPAASTKKSTAVKKPAPAKKGVKRTKSGKKKKEAEEEEEEEDLEEEYEIESILDHQVVQGVHYWLVSWKGHDDEADQWIRIWEGLDTSGLKKFKKYVKAKMNKGDENKVNTNQTVESNFIYLSNSCRSHHCFANVFVSYVQITVGGSQRTNLIPAAILRQAGDKYVVHWQGLSDFYDSLESLETVTQASGVLDSWNKKPDKLIEAKQIIVQKSESDEEKEGSGSDEEEEAAASKKKPKTGGSQKKGSGGKK